MKKYVSIIILLYCVNSVCLAQNKFKPDMPTDTFLIANYITHALYVVDEIKTVGEPRLYSINKLTKKVELINGYNKETQTGIKYEFYTQSKIKSIKYYLEGKHEGFIYEFHENGKISHIAYYVLGVMEGLEYYLYKNGNVWLEHHYQNGLFHGVIKKFYYGRGKLLYETNYENGIKQGVETSYFRSGKISMITRYKDGKAFEGERYNRRGEIIRKTYYDKGKLIKTVYLKGCKKND